jgi:hypothetical protein
MATPTFSISVPEEERDTVRAELPELLDFAALDGTPASLSYLVRQMIVNAERLSTFELNQFMAKESAKGGNKRYIVIQIR